MKERLGDKERLGSRKEDLLLHSVTVKIPPYYPDFFLTKIFYIEGREGEEHFGGTTRRGEPAD